ncbi:MAG: hypothetical protein GQ577_01580 [Woeseiaceae bacterium]|nr:hypothetical protein [Woeseiaceae bacterium]
MRSHFLFMAAGSLFLLAGCSETPVPFEPQLVNVPAGAPATGPRISGDETTGLVLSWMEQDDDGASLHYARLEDGTWSDASVVVDGVDMFVNWADMPSVQPLGTGRLAAHWLQMSADMTYAYDVMFAQSADDGQSWSEPIRPHSDGTETEHGFVSMFSDGNRTGLIWLDGRKMVNEVTDDPVASGMTLRAASVDENQNVEQEQLVDELICDCCQTDIAIASSGPVAVYRDRSSAEIRDIYVTRYVDGQWLTGKPVASDNWKIPGCPVNGPSIVADGSFVAVAWFTGSGGRPVVRLSVSDDSGETFGEPLDVADGSVLGRVGLVHLGKGAVAVSWLQSGADGSHDVVIRRIEAGVAGSVHTVAHNAGSFSVPQIALAGEDLIFVWTETEEFENSVHSARVAAKAL